MAPTDLRAVAAARFEGRAGAADVLRLAVAAGGRVIQTSLSMFHQ
jgi:hypothetical protein